MNVSVVIPVFDGEKYLAAAIESILGQTVPPAAIIVVDDGSSDGSRAVAESFGSSVRCIARTHAGGAATLNHGIEVVATELIAFLDADDLWLPTKLEAQLAELAARPEIDLVFGHVQQFLSPDLTPERAARLICPTEPQPGRYASALLARRAVFDLVGLLATDLRTGWFIDWSMRAVDLGVRHVMLPEVVVKRRIHGQNLGLRDKDGRVDYLEVLKRVVERRRQGS